MNIAQYLLDSMEKTASKGLVMAAVEAATGAAIGGTLGLSSARKDRSQDPIGRSDIAGATYGALLGALAGAGAGSILRDSAAQRGIRADQRLKSLAETVTQVENGAAIARANVDNWNQTAVRDLLYSQNHPGHTFSQVEQQRAQLQGLLKQQTQQKNQLHREIRNLRKQGLDTQHLDYQMSDLMDQIKDTQLVRSGMSQRLTEIAKLEKGDLNSAKTMAKQYQEMAGQRRAELDSYRKLVEQRERNAANSKFMGIF